MLADHEITYKHMIKAVLNLDNPKKTIIYFRINFILNGGLT